ncbi:GMP synthase [Microbacterium sp. HD4P20]|uniref:glutamine amidotransferase-related protein n=1 Tax=Microbacterium sp. HD4P20 TaxID=2864874 RepID=UPI001C63BA34|nr:GMP synthase [Microbacterium sp. HD4P20]MCP2637968.1 GMP synthase [Microbacterium sp. HD4P20]
MTTAPLLYVCVRPQQGAAAAEYESFRSAMRVGEGELQRHDLVRDPLPPDVFDRFSGFVIGGSPFNVADPESTKTDPQRRLESDLERIAARTAEGDGPAALFTCYGIGIVTRLLGGRVSRAFPEDTGPVTIELTAAAAADPVFGGIANRFTALTAHKEGTEAMPTGAIQLATNRACPVQAYVVGDRLYATQFHPEPTTQAFTERMAVYRDDGYFEASAYDEIAARVLGASLTEPARLLRAFARRFRPAAD